jgi:integrase
MRFTAANVAQLKRPADKDDIVIWDDSLPGFGVRLRGDSKTWLVQYRFGVQQRRESLGDIRQVTLEDARKAARQRFAKLRLGVDPAAERAKARAEAALVKLTVGNVAERYLDAKASALRPRTYNQAKLHFTDHWKPFVDRPLDSITRQQVAARLQELIKARGRIAAARARANLSALYQWARKEGLTENNPVTHTHDPAAGVPPRERVLSQRELATVWKACRNDDFGCIVRLLILSGCRRQEIGDLKYSEIDFDRGIVTIAGARTKNHRALTLPLSSVAFDLLRLPQRDGRENVFGGGPEGFSAWSYSTMALNGRIAAAEGKPLPHWTLHDLRRSAATHMAEIGIQPHIIEAILNHQSGHKAGVAGIYNRASYEREKAAALATWAEHVLAIVEGRTSKVVPLRA